MPDRGDGRTASAVAPLPDDVRVSIVIASRDRPADLRECLAAVAAQRTTRVVDVIVVDNHPASGLTPSVVAEFPTVRLVNEPRQGLAYARNAGFLACHGEIAVATDDDVLPPPEWLETLLQPFTDAAVMVVTGNVVAFELQTEAQRLFEAYGGLGRGVTRKVANPHWFRGCRSAVPTWTLGATANAAFRTVLFDDPRVGLMDEALGPGMPSGVGEDSYLLYKVLQAGGTIVYEPAAWVWHKHRRDMAALKRQIYGYSTGHVAHHLTTLLRDGDLRALVNLCVLLPAYHARRVLRWAAGDRTYPLALLALEVRGNLAGPWALWQSRRRVRREGRSRPAAPIQVRA